MAEDNVPARSASSTTFGRLSTDLVCGAVVAPDHEIASRRARWLPTGWLSLGPPASVTRVRHPYVQQCAAATT